MGQGGQGWFAGVYYGWVMVAIAFINMAITGTAHVSFSLFYVAVIGEFGWQRASAALAFSLSMVVFSLAGLGIGSLVDRFGPRRVMPVGAVLLAMGLAAASRISALWHFYVLYGVVIALGISMVGYIPNTINLSRWFVRRRATAVGLALAGSGVGNLVLLPTLQGIISRQGWRLAYLFLALLALVILAPLNALFQRRRFEGPGLGPHDLAPTASTSTDGARGTGAMADARVVDRAWVATDWTVGRVLRTRRYWALAIAGFFSGFSLVSIFVHQVAYMVDLGYPAIVAATAVGWNNMVWAAGTILGGMLSDRIGRELTFTLGTALSMVGLLILLNLHMVQASWPLYSYALLFGFGVGTTGSTSAALQADLFQGRHFGAVFGLLQIGFGLGGTLGPWLTGLSFDWLGNYRVVFTAILGLMAITCSCIWIAAPRKVRLVGAS